MECLGGAGGVWDERRWGEVSAGVGEGLVQRFLPGEMWALGSRICQCLVGSGPRAGRFLGERRAGECVAERGVFGGRIGRLAQCFGATGAESGWRSLKRMGLCGKGKSETGRADAGGGDGFWRWFGREECRAGVWAVGGAAVAWARGNGGGGQCGFSGFRA